MFMFQICLLIVLCCVSVMTITSQATKVMVMCERKFSNYGKQQVIRNDGVYEDGLRVVRIYPNGTWDKNDVNAYRNNRKVIGCVEGTEVYQEVEKDSVETDVITPTHIGSTQSMSLSPINRIILNLGLTASSEYKLAGATIQMWHIVQEFDVTKGSFFYSADFGSICILSYSLKTRQAPSGLYYTSGTIDYVTKYIYTRQACVRQCYTSKVIGGSVININNTAVYAQHLIPVINSVEGFVYAGQVVGICGNGYGNSGFSSITYSSMTASDQYLN